MYVRRGLVGGKVNGPEKIKRAKFLAVGKILSITRIMLTNSRFSKIKSLITVASQCWRLGETIFSASVVSQLLAVYAEYNSNHPVISFIVSPHYACFTPSFELTLLRSPSQDDGRPT